MTKPNEKEAFILFSLFTTARFTHTVVYSIYIIPQPARWLAFFTGFVVTGFMLVKVIVFSFQQ